MVADEDKKPAATSPSSASSPSKRRKTMEEIYDVADQLGFRSGDRFEVKWTIRDEDDDHGIEGAAVGNNYVQVAGDDVDDSGGITVWWSATLIQKTDRMHTLTDEDMTEGESPQFAGPVVKVPIYELKYEPMQEHGFDTYSVEEVAFTSDKMLLNLSTNEIMTFRMAGQPSPPSSPGPEERETAATMAVGVGCTRDEMITVINDIMQRSLKNTGMDQRMKSLPASQQLMMAERLRHSQELLLEKLLEETDKMKGERIITEDVVRKCIAQMNS